MHDLTISATIWNADGQSVAVTAISVPEFLEKLPAIVALLPPAPPTEDNLAATVATGLGAEQALNPQPEPVDESTDANAALDNDKEQEVHA
jgi:hypothetical protein